MKRKKERERRGYLVTIERNNKQELEQFRSIRSNINFSSINKRISTIVITSPSPGDGKSMTAANLAIVFGQEGKKVLLVDADLRRPTIHHIFRLPNQLGLSNFLIGQETISSITNEMFENLDVITSGIIPPNPPELLGSTQMNDFVSVVTRNYDVIVFDTPPVLAVTDPTILANQCDGTVLVVRAKKNEMKDVKKAKEMLSFAGATLLGAVLNGKKQPKNHYYSE